MSCSMSCRSNTGYFLTEQCPPPSKPPSLTCTNPTPSPLLALPTSPCSRSEPCLITPCCFHANHLASKKHLKAKRYLPYSLEMEAQDSNCPPFLSPAKFKKSARKCWALSLPVLFLHQTTAANAQWVWKLLLGAESNTQPKSQGALFL